MSTRSKINSYCARFSRATTPRSSWQVHVPQRLRIEPIIFPPALPDQPHAARMCHDHFVPQPAQHSAHPRRMHPRLQCDPAARHASQHLLHSFRGRTHSRFQLYFAALIQHAVPT